MRSSLKISIYLGLLLGTFSMVSAQSQTWRPAMEGFSSYQIPGYQDHFFSIRFMPHGPMGKDWIYGIWLDQDSLVRLAGYREGGRWKPLPIHTRHDTFPNNSYVRDMVMYGDTLYMGGQFYRMHRDKDSSQIPYTTLLKVHGDSIWSDQQIINTIRDMDASGDSLLVWANLYIWSTDTLGGHMLATQGGRVWNQAFSIPHPTDSNIVQFGADNVCVIRNGDIITINNGSEGPYGGIARWDGQQWHSYGQGVRGTYSNTTDFDFYRDELYMTGSFNKWESPLNPGQFIARWDGQQWHEVAGGFDQSGIDLWPSGNKLYCEIVGERFGDAKIASLAAWDGHQWCGTPITYTLDNGDPLGSHHHLSYGVIKDTLYMVSYHLPQHPIHANGQPLAFLNYFDGDYVNGPSAICSTLGIGEEGSPSLPAFALYPNPAGEEIKASCGEGLIELLKVYDLTGRCVLQQPAKAKKVVLDVSGLVPGIYLLEVNGGVQRKFVKE